MEWHTKLGLSGTEALLVVIIAIAMYLSVIIYTRIAGQRSIHRSSTFDFLVSVAIGAVVGRVLLVRTSLAAGVLGLGVLFATQGLISFLRRRGLLDGLVDNPPRLLVANGEVLTEALRRAHLSESDLREELRLKGVTELRAVRAAILEKSGNVSVLTGPGAIGDELLEGVPGREQVATVHA